MIAPFVRKAAGGRLSLASSCNDSSEILVTHMLESLGDRLILVLNKMYFWVLGMTYIKIPDLFLLVNQPYILEDHIE